MPYADAVVPSYVVAAAVILKFFAVRGRKCR